MISEIKKDVGEGTPLITMDQNSCKEAVPVKIDWRMYNVEMSKWYRFKENLPYFGLPLDPKISILAQFCDRNSIMWQTEKNWYLLSLVDH